MREHSLGLVDGRQCLLLEFVDFFLKFGILEIIVLIIHGIGIVFDELNASIGVQEVVHEERKELILHEDLLFLLAILVHGNSDIIETNVVPIFLDLSKELNSELIIFVVSMTKNVKCQDIDQPFFELCRLDVFQ